VRGRAGKRCVRSPSPPIDPTRAATLVYGSPSPVRGGAAGGSSRRWSPGIRSVSPPNAPRARSPSPDVPHRTQWRRTGHSPQALVFYNALPVADLLDRFPVFGAEEIGAARRCKQASWDALYTLLYGEIKAFLDARTGDDWADAQSAMRDNQTHLLQNEFDRLEVPGSDALRRKLRNAVRVHTNATDAHVSMTMRRQVCELTTYITDTVGSKQAHAGWSAVHAQRLADTQLYMRCDMNFMRLWTVFRDYGSRHEHQRYANVVAHLLTHHLF